MSGAATLESFQRCRRAEPQLESCAPAASAISLHERTVLHAGPPFENTSVIPAPVLQQRNCGGAIDADGEAGLIGRGIAPW
jgi:hypothetical protein